MNKQCIQCHIEYNPVRSNQKYCSGSCQQRFQYEQYIIRWLEGKENGRRGSTLTSKHIHRWLREQRGEVCWDCGWNKKHSIDGKVPLELDHIDGNHTNNIPDNLRLLCPNCHALTATYKNRNKGNGRHERRERYKSGKSY